MPKTAWVAPLVFASLFALLFQYRILSLFKKLGAGVSPLGTKLPITLDFEHAPAWLLPFYHTFDYINTIWFTTILGLLLAGAAVAFLPGLVQKRLGGSGAGQHLNGVLLGLPNMLCTCCAVGACAGLRRAGAGLGASLALFVSAPALNLVVIVLAFELLPFKLAMARLVLGLVASLGATYAVARLVAAEPPATAPAPARAAQSPTALLTAWLSQTWRISKSVLPVLLIGFLLVGVFKTVVPMTAVAAQLDGGLWSTALASLNGSVLMVPTFTEVLWVDEFTRQGMTTAPAAALLITLPAVSLPSLWVLGRVLKSYKAAALLAVLMIALGIVGGTLVALI